MPINPTSRPEAIYLESLRWRHDWLKTELTTVQARIQDLSRQEASLTVQLRAVEQLLSLEPVQRAAWPAEPSSGPSPARARANGTDSVVTTPAALEPAEVDWSAFGPKSRMIYMAAADVLREAGVPLHYRALAEEVQKQVPLAGTDPGATLIAHLHRAGQLFPRMGRGIYGLAASTPGAASQGAASPAEPSVSTSEPLTKRRRRRVVRRRRSR